ncbi:uncharacterized protein CDAR_612471 [Caerostris darwini]|uniref:Uncharacterized protein n=1 Tax=Caerostris darwini TaxID=1538125 RepID=A0AAV4SHJ8_9ARAC|nr:uncharacterized protein CDAR_612471 [Caerostris darwini]
MQIRYLPLLVVRKPLSFSGESIPRVSCSRTSLNRRRDGVRNTKPAWGSNPSSGNSERQSTPPYERKITSSASCLFWGSWGTILLLLNACRDVSLLWQRLLHLWGEHISIRRHSSILSAYLPYPYTKYFQI